MHEASNRVPSGQFAVGNDQLFAVVMELLGSVTAYNSEIDHTYCSSQTSVPTKIRELAPA